MAEKTHTHRAYAARREGHKVRWLEIGVACLSDGGGFDLFVDRLPVGGFNGHILVRPNGTTPEETSGSGSAEP
jgi:hypothetical protein